MKLQMKNHIFYDNSYIVMYLSLTKKSIDINYNIVHFTKENKTKSYFKFK